MTTTAEKLKTAAAKRAAQTEAEVPALPTKKPRKPRTPSAQVLAALEAKLASYDERNAERRAALVTKIENRRNGTRILVTKAEVLENIPPGVSLEEAHARIQGKLARLRAEAKVLKGLREETANDPTIEAPHEEPDEDEAEDEDKEA